MLYQPRGRRPAPRLLNLAQSSWPKGYVSTLEESRIPPDALSDLTNCELVQDSLPRPRPSLVQYGGDALGTFYGMGTFIKLVNGLPEFWEISLQDTGGAIQVCVRKDGAAWTAKGGDYDATGWATFCQGGQYDSGTLDSRVYINNGVDAMSYFDINDDNIVAGSALSTPGTPTMTRTGLSGSNYTYYLKITAINAFGETAGSAEQSQAVSALRETWDSTSNFITYSWSAVTDAVAYKLYLSDQSGQESYLTTVSGLSFKDDGSTAINIFSLCPSTDSTTGPVLNFMWNTNDQLFGVGDVNNPQYLWYSGIGQDFGNFADGGGGFVAINYGGDTVPMAVIAFRTGKGDPAVTVFSRGGGGSGKLHHVNFSSTTVGDTLVVTPEVLEASGSDGTISSYAVILLNGTAYYPTGPSFKSTGTKPSVINILSTDDIAQQIQPDTANLSLSAMRKSVGCAFQGKIYWALPTGTNTENNEIWVLDLTRKGLWILRWTVAAQWLWVYESNDGIPHFCALVGGKTMEFTRSVATTDDGTPFRTRAASGALTWDPTGVTLADIDTQRFRLLLPKGGININVYGLGDDDSASLSLLNSETYTQTIGRTGWGQLRYSLPTQLGYDQDVGAIDSFSTRVKVQPVEVDETLNELEWEIVTEGADADYTLAGVHTRGSEVDGSFKGD